MPIGTKDSYIGKWSPTWEGPFKINQYVPGNVYILETLEGEEFSRALNGKYLKKYYPSVWVDAQPVNQASVEFWNMTDTVNVIFTMRNTEKPIVI